MRQGTHRELPPQWWRKAVFYQIYPRSFCDSTGSGVGDLRGIVSKLDYLQTLGIDGIWLSPVCASPQVDNGYDISDYCAIDPLFGTMEDMEELIREAAERKIAIILDLVLNHSSDRHPWFLEARKGRDNPYHDYYIWREGKDGCPPNDMRSVFGGSAWSYVPELGLYYFHQFSPAQPDLNWDNPKLRRELYDSILFWVKKGVRGFRLDVIDQIAKEPDSYITINGPKLHEYLRELSAACFQESSIVTVGEAWGANVERARQYSAADGSELSMVFQFEHMGLEQTDGSKWNRKPLYLPELKHCYEDWQQGLHGYGWNSLFLNNHDLPRIVSRWGDDGQYRVLSAKMLATMLYGMEGTPFIYQGEELGMTNISREIGEYRDLETLNYYEEARQAGLSHERIMDSVHSRSRDNARTPMQWSAAAQGGFTKGEAWMEVNENYTFINAESQTDREDSVFSYYRKLIRLRKEREIFTEGSFRLLLPEDERIFAYERESEREKLLVVCNFSGNEQTFTPSHEYETGRCLISNYGDLDKCLRPYEAYMIYVQKA